MPVNNPISVTRNGSYGGATNNNKYKPFNGITVVNAPANIADYSFLTDDRMALLNARGVFPANLNLTLPSWQAAIRDENTGGVGGAAKHPPLVVISSNRSRYILAGVTSANAQLAALPGPPASFRNINDLRAFPALAPGALSPPIYCPTRLDPAFPRNVYVVVHYSEYADYQANLGPTGINVVGWAFSNPGPQPNFLSGFGASRYAALEFCKQLRAQAGAANGGTFPWDAAWLLDDNVVAIERLQSLNAVEGALGIAVCAGFHGQSVPMNFSQINQWANTTVPLNQRAGQNLPPLPPVQTHGLVQQAVCWNIAQLVAQNLNFSPIFVDSKEDVSLTDYFNTLPVAYQWYNKRIIKETVTLHDNAPGVGGALALQGANLVQIARGNWATDFANIEQNTPIQPPGGAPATTLRLYIDTVVVPNAAAMAAVPVNVHTLRHAACQAVETIIARAIRGGFPPSGSPTYVAAASLAATFSPVAVPPLVVTRRDV